jgi:hypothetical protein
MGFRAQDLDQDFLSGYESFLPRNTPKTNSLECRTNGNHGSYFEEIMDCNARLQTEHILTARVILHNSVVMQVILITEGVELGHLVSKWGRPESVNRYPKVYMALWNQNGQTIYACMARRGWLTYQSEVRLVSIAGYP